MFPFLLGGKGLGDDRRLDDLLEGTDQTKVVLYLRDLGPQIGWRTVFLAEYSGPLVIYLTMWVLRQPELRNPLLSPIESHIGLRCLACLCWCGHYTKRILETLFVHRFSHATMPLFNVFRNCGYYFGFAFFVSYFVNHPLYTFPSKFLYNAFLETCFLPTFPSDFSPLSLIPVEGPWLLL